MCAEGRLVEARLTSWVVMAGLITCRHSMNCFRLMASTTGSLLVLAPPPGPPRPSLSEGPLPPLSSMLRWKSRRGRRRQSVATDLFSSTNTVSVHSTPVSSENQAVSLGSEQVRSGHLNRRNPTSAAVERSTASLAGCSSLTFIAGEGGLLQDSVHARVLVEQEPRVFLPVGAHIAPRLDKQVNQIVHVLHTKCKYSLGCQ